MKQTALITGASKRIGKAIAVYLAERGWNIIIHYNFSKRDAEHLIDALSGQYAGQNFSAVQADLSDVSQVASLIPKVVSELGEFDLLVNNASVFDKSYLAETSVELFDSQIDVNLKAPFVLIRDFANYCKQGNIVNFVDTRIKSNKSNFMAYSLSKKGLWDLTKMAALELAPEIRVNAIAPGATLAPADEDDDYLDRVAAGTPMRKPGGVEPVLKCVDFILNNPNLTGQLLFADGGENLGTNI